MDILSEAKKKVLQTESVNNINQMFPILNYQPTHLFPKKNISPAKHLTMYESSVIEEGLKGLVSAF